MKKKLRHSTATYEDAKGSQECDLVELAETYRKIGNIPERIGWVKACEIALLAQAFLILNEKYEKEQSK